MDDQSLLDADSGQWALRVDAVELDAGHCPQIGMPARLATLIHPLGDSRE